MRFLIIGDVVGRPGREVVTTVLPQLRQQYSPDHLIINIENMAHGNGISPDTWQEAALWEADVYTTGDHAWDNEKGVPLLENTDLPIIRPVNYPDGVPGRGWHILSSGAFKIAVINIQGQVFFKNDPANPFAALDQLLTKPYIANADIVLVDFHAEASSEKRAFGWHADGRVAAVWGTNTHVPTADAQILPQGTAYISDIGMAGLHHSIIGGDIAPSLKRFRTQLKAKLTYDDGGPREVNGVVIDVDPSTQGATHIESVRIISS